MTNPVVRPAGLRTLVEGVTSFFRVQKVDAAVDAGWKRRTFQINQGPGGANRVVFCPGDEAGNVGKIEQPRHKSSNPRCLRQHEFLITVSVWSCDTAALEDELAQQDAIEALLERTFQAIHSVAKADWVAGTMKELRPGAEMAFGRERQFQMVLKQEFFDVTLETFTATPSITPVFNPPGGT